MWKNFVLNIKLCIFTCTFKQIEIPSSSSVSLQHSITSHALVGNNMKKINPKMKETSQFEVNDFCLFFACKRETSERSTSEPKQEVETLIQEAAFTFP